MSEREYIMEKQFHEVEVQLDAYRRAFRNLMAVIDRDGGHAQTGYPKVDGKRGEDTVVFLRHDLAELKRLLSIECAEQHVAELTFPPQLTDKEREVVAMHVKGFAAWVLNKFRRIKKAVREDD